MKESQGTIKMSSSEKAIKTLVQFIKSQGGSSEGTENFETFEQELHELIQTIECKVMAEKLSSYDMDESTIIVDGIRFHRALRCKETYFGSAGQIRVNRSLFTSRESGARTICPLELRAGIIEERWTPLAAKQASWVVAHLTPGTSEQLFKQLGGMKPSKSTLDRLPKQLNIRWEEKRERFESLLRSQEQVPERAVVVGVFLDGVMVPMKDGNRKKKRQEAVETGKQPKGPNGYREVGCGTVTFYDDEGQRLSTSRMGRMPERKKQTLKEMLRDELDAVLAERPDLTVVKMADGAKDNWTFLSKELPVPGREVIDFFHACEHLDTALIAAYGETNSKRNTQFKKFRTVLKDETDGVEKVIRALVYLSNKHPRRQNIRKELWYFRRNRHRMKYAELLKDMLPIGTGVIEAACKTLATQRLKQSGMRWSLEGGQAILTLRSAIQSERFERFWNLLANSYKSSTVAPDNIIQFEDYNSLEDQAA